MFNSISVYANRLYKASQVQQLDRNFIKRGNTSGENLMERAGQAAYQLLRQQWPEIRSLLILCGPGNNGGDGFVIARLAAAEGLSVSVVCNVEKNKLSGDAKFAADKLFAAGIEFQTFSAELIDQCDLVVDAMLGTGLDRDVSGEIRSWIEIINNTRSPVFSIDIPSGLAADTGKIMGVAVAADATITFIGIKQGLLTANGNALTGPLYYDDLGCPADVQDSLTPSSFRFDFEDSSKWLSPRKRNAHKGDFGHVLVVGGDRGFAGASRMAAESAARSGAGLVSIATRPENVASITAVRPELMVHGINTSNDLNDLLHKSSVIAIGPGLGQSEWSRILLGKTLEINKFLVVDADALNLLAVDPVKNDHWILTPHPGEAARLLNCSSTEIQDDRFAAISELQNKFGGIIVLKGNGTLVIDENRQIFICSDGNPGMATGGMGDILTGVIAGFVAQKYSLSRAAKLGVSLHAHAADLAARMGERGMLACDVLPYIRQLANPQ